MKENNLDYMQKLSDYYGVENIEIKEIKKGETKKILYNIRMKNGQTFTINSTEKEILHI